MNLSKDISLQLLTLLKSCYDISTSKTEFLSSDLHNNTSILDSINLHYNSTAEGIQLTLKNSHIEIYKTKLDAIEYSQNYSIPILIIEDQLIYLPDESSNIFFENLIYAGKIKKIIIEKLNPFQEPIKKTLTFLSATKGEFSVGYKNKEPVFYEKNHDLQKLSLLLETKLNEPEFVSFFRNNIIYRVEDVDNINDRFLKLLERLNSIFEKSSREFELYKNNFSFEEFNSSLEKEKEKYIKNLQENLGDFLSKVNALPIQFGVYIFLIFKFEYQAIPLIATAILILIWSGFTFFSLNILEVSIIFLENKFKKVFKKILEGSGIKEQELKDDKNEINTKIKNIKSLILGYQITVIIMTTIFLLFICFKLIPPII